jgi:hypothetical protein
MGERTTLSHYSGGSCLFRLAVACCTQSHHLPCVRFACRVNKAWLIMTVSVIFQSHNFSLVNILHFGHLFNIASLFYELFELGNNCP